MKSIRGGKLICSCGWSLGRSAHGRLRISSGLVGGRARVLERVLLYVLDPQALGACMTRVKLLAGIMPGVVSLCVIFVVL